MIGCRIGVFTEIRSNEDGTSIISATAYTPQSRLDESLSSAEPEVSPAPPVSEPRMSHFTDPEAVGRLLQHRSMRDKIAIARDCRSAP